MALVEPRGPGKALGGQIPRPLKGHEGVASKKRHRCKRLADADQLWQSIHLTLTSGKRQLTTLENEDCLVCRKPTDEIADLVGNLRKP